jgi:hypothetical protein
MSRLAVADPRRPHRTRLGYGRLGVTKRTGPFGHHQTRWECSCGEVGPWRRSKSHAQDGGYFHEHHANREAVR